MKTNKLILFFLLPGILLLQTCKKVEKEMLVSTGTVSNILITSAVISGKILDLGQGATQYGHCYSKTSNPTIGDATIDHSSPRLGDFTSTLEGLDAGTKYYVKAYLSRGKDVVYGNEISFTTAAATLPTVTTTEITKITTGSAVSGGNITDEGGTPVKERGVCWSLATITSLTNNKTTDGPGTGTFTSEITGLASGTNYFVRAYATNSGGTKLGNEITFTTTPDTPIPPTVTTTEVNSVTSNSAISGGNVTSEGSSSVIARGVCWNTSPNPKISDSKTTNGSGSGSFVSNLTSLSPGTTYYVRAYATNSAGTSYADAIYEYSFTTLCISPSASTSAASSIGNKTATLNGTVNANDFSTTVTFEYGTTTGYGSSATAAQSPVTGNSNTNVNAGITGLIPNNTYHYRIKAINCLLAPIYGNDQTFTTLCTTSSAITSAATNINKTTATLNGTVNANDFSTTVTFEYGTTTGYGSTATAAQSPVTGNSNTNVSAGITGLTNNTTYHYRIKVINCGGTVYSNDQTFLTDPITVTDVDGNIYDVIRIGTQLWLVQNLKTTKYNDNTNIPLVTDNTAWSQLATRGYCWYNNDPTTYKNVYGALYNAYTVFTGNLCPVNWHVPTDAEWTILVNYLGGESVAGDKLKEAGTFHWPSPNTATNSSGFTALPGGMRTSAGVFSGNGFIGYLWSSTEYSSLFAWYREITNLGSVYRQNYYKTNGHSVRCVRDY